MKNFAAHFQNALKNLSYRFGSALCRVHGRQKEIAPNEVNSARIRPSKMSEQFFYVHLKFIPKIVTLTVTILRQREVVVEVSKRLVQHSQSKLLNENPGEKAIALDLARRVALDTFPTVAGRILGLYDEAAPTWHEQRHHVMNERPCNHEENGTRAWRII